MGPSAAWGRDSARGRSRVARRTLDSVLVPSFEALEEYLRDEVQGLMGFEETGVTWGGMQRSLDALWSDGYMWLQSGVDANGFVWSDGFMWLNGYSWLDGYLWLDGYSWLNDAPLDE